MNIISQKVILGLFACLICRCTVLCARMLLFCVQVKGHFRSTGVKLQKSSEHNIMTGNLELVLYLVCAFFTMTVMRFYSVVEDKVYLRSPRFKSQKAWYLKHTLISHERKLVNQLHIWCVYLQEREKKKIKFGTM